MNRKIGVSIASVLFGLLLSPAYGQDTTSEIDILKKQVDLEKQKNAAQVDLLASQKSLIDAQKANSDAQNLLVGSQKAALDALFPQIVGGKTGAITFDAATNVGPIAQPGAVEALNTLGLGICKTLKGKLGKQVVLVSDSDLKLVAQARAVSMQLQSLIEGYKAVKTSAPPPKFSTNALPAGLALYGAGAALKEVASFTQLFRTDTTIFAATVNIDQEALNHAVVGCITTAETSLYTPKSLLVSSLSKPALSTIHENLKNLAELRLNADAELATLAGKTESSSKTASAKLTALNSAMDAMISTLFSTSEKVPEPQFVGVIAGEAIFQKVGDGATLLRLLLANASATGVKRTSIWFSDRLYSWSTITADYLLFDPNGAVLASGVVNVSPEAKKVIIAR